MLLVELPQTLLPSQADTVDDLNHLAVSYRSSRGEVNSVSFSKLDSAEMRVEPGPINWAAIRNKYFLVAYRASKIPFSALRLQGAPRKGKIAEEMHGSIAMPVGVDGTVAFDIYAGPQNFERLQHLGGDLDQVNPYAGWLHGVVQPFATMVMKALLWMKRTTQLNYGWVLVLFGVIVRLILWPLNQGRDADKHENAAPPARTSGAAEEVQRRSEEAARSDHEGVQGTWHESPEPTHGVSANAPADASALCSLLRVSEHDRVPWSVLPLAFGYLPARSVLYHPAPHGRVHVRDVVDRDAELAAESTGEDDELHDAGDAHGALPQLCIRAESLLRRAEHRGNSTAMVAGA